MAKIMNPMLPIYSLFWDIGPLFGVFLEVQVPPFLKGASSPGGCQSLGRMAPFAPRKRHTKRPVFNAGSRGRSRRSRDLMYQLLLQEGIVFTYSQKAKNCSPYMLSTLANLCIGAVSAVCSMGA